MAHGRAIASSPRYAPLALRIPVGYFALSLPDATTTLGKLKTGSFPKEVPPS